MSLVQAAACAATNPARVLGFTDRGAISTGRLADLVVLDTDLQVQAVIASGEVVAGKLPQHPEA